MPLDHTMPAAHALHLVEAVARWGVSGQELLAPFGLEPEALGEPRARLPLATVEKLVERACVLTGEPGLGIYLGLSMRASAHGFVGFAAMSAATVGQALELAARFAPIRTSALALHLVVDGELASPNRASSAGTARLGGDSARSARLASLVLEERAPLGAAREVVVFALLVGLWQIGCAITGRELEGTAEVAFVEPAWFGRFLPAVPGRLRFGQPLHRLIFPASTLELPIAMADAAALRLAREECERELEALGAGESEVVRVRRELERGGGGFRALDEVARRLHLSTRTLKRRLAAEGTTFSRVLDEARREHALLLLRSPERSLDQIAERLGYSDCANFSRAFRRWTGRSPGAFRFSASSR